MMEKRLAGVTEAGGLPLRREALGAVARRGRVRQALLALLIDNRILTKNEVVSYLDFFIRQRRGQSKFAIAVSKWEEDREFVYGYRAGTFTKRRAHEIRRPASVR